MGGAVTEEIYAQEVIAGSLMAEQLDGLVMEQTL